MISDNYKCEYWKLPCTMESYNLIYFNGAPVINRQEFCLVCGPRKAFKTHFVWKIVGACLGAPQERSLGFSVEHALKVIVLDTEQNQFDIHAVATGALADSGHETDIECSMLRVYQLNGDVIMKNKILDEAIRTIAPDVVIIDGLADLIPDINDSNMGMCTPRHLKELAMTSNCAIIGTIHANYGTDKERGHLGSNAGNMASSGFLLRKDGGTVTISSGDYNRHEPIEPFAIRFDDEQKNIVRTAYVEKPKRKKRDPSTQARIDAVVAYVHNYPGSSQREIVANVAESSGNTSDSSKKSLVRALTYATDDGWLYKTGELFNFTSETSVLRQTDGYLE